MSAARKIVDEISRGGLTLLDNVCEVIDRDCGWRPAGELLSDGREIIVRVETRYRWLPYEQNSTYAKRGLTGRWQRQNERGAWETVPAPTGLWREG